MEINLKNELPARLRCNDTWQVVPGDSQLNMSRAAVMSWVMSGRWIYTKLIHEQIMKQF